MPVSPNRRRQPGPKGPSVELIHAVVEDSRPSLPAGSTDLFRCESATLRSHWVLVVMDQYTRRIIGFDVHGERSMVSHSVVCSTAPFESIAGCRFHQCQANLRLL